MNRESLRLGSWGLSRCPLAQWRPQGGHIARLSATMESCNEAEKPQEEASDVPSLLLALNKVSCEYQSYQRAVKFHESSWKPWSQKLIQGEV